MKIIFKACKPRLHLPFDNASAYYILSVVEHYCLSRSNSALRFIKNYVHQTIITRFDSSRNILHSVACLRSYTHRFRKLINRNKVHIACPQLLAKECVIRAKNNSVSSNVLANNVKRILVGNTQAFTLTYGVEVCASMSSNLFTIAYGITIWLRQLFNIGISVKAWV